MFAKRAGAKNWAGNYPNVYMFSLVWNGWHALLRSPGGSQVQNSFRIGIGLSWSTSYIAARHHPLQTEIHLLSASLNYFTFRRCRSETSTFTVGIMGGSWNLLHRLAREGGWFLSLLENSSLKRNSSVFSVFQN